MIFVFKNRLSLIYQNEIIMTTYKQKNFKRDYEATNIKFIQVAGDEILDSKYWVVCDSSEIDCNQLWKEGNKIMYGYL